MKISAILFRFLSACSVFLALPVVTYALSEIPLKGGEKLRIQADRLQIDYQVREKDSSLRLILSENAAEALQVQTEGNLIRVLPRDQRREALATLPQGGKWTLLIQGPAVPTEVFVSEGVFQVEKWTQILFVNGKNFNLNVKNSSGTVRAQIQKGQISIADFSGGLEIDSYQAQVTVRNSTGDLNLKNFNGETNLEKYSGVIQLSQSQSQARVRDSSGTLKYKVHRGQLNTQQFSGRIEGQLLDGQVHLGVSAESEVNVQAQAGRVTVVLPQGSGAALNLVTGSGEITGPNYLRVQRGAAEKTLTGRLRGSLPGSVRVRAVDAFIQVR
jgi:hypothetical protein